MGAPSRRLAFRLFWALVVLILLLGMILRLVGNMRLPLFLDEAMHLGWVRQVLGGRLFIGFENNKWLYPVILAPFQLTGPEAPWLARSLSALMGALTVSGCVALGRSLGDRRTGLLAGLLYAVMPMAVFHEQQALVDPLLATLTTLATVWMVRLARTPRWWIGLLLGVTLAGAYLTKVAALPYMVLPAVAVVFLARRCDIAWRALVIAGLGIALAAGIIAVAYHQAAQQGDVPSAIYQISLDNLVFGGAERGRTTARLLNDFQTYLDMLLRYAGWAVIALTVLAGGWALIGESRRSILFLAVPALAFAAVPILAERPAGFLAPRYLLATAAPLATLAALSLRIALTRLEKLRKGAARWGGVALLTATLGPALWFDLTLIRDPAQAPLTAVDRVQYIIGDPSGYGRTDIAKVLLEAWRTGDGARVDALMTGSREQIVAYLGPRVGEFLLLHPEEADQRVVLAGWLARGDQVFCVEGSPDVPVPDAPHGARLEHIGNYESGAGMLRLFRVVGADGPLADEVYTRLVPDAERMMDDYAALAATLEGPGPVLIFPAGHVPTLEALTDLEVIPLTVGAWPANLDAAEAALTRLALGEDGSPVELVLVDEASADPARTVALAAQRQLYGVDEAWFGYLHRLSYVTGPTEPAMTELNAQYEGVIELAQAAVLDPTVHPGDTVRVALRWRLSEPVRDSFVVFAHVVDEAGTLWAQHDSVPGGGLLPMTDWESSQEVLDRVAIRLPSDLSAGEYVVWVGLYFPESGVRLAVTDAQEAGPDYVVVGRFAVAPN